MDPQKNSKSKNQQLSSWWIYCTPLRNGVYLYSIDHIPAYSSIFLSFVPCLTSTSETALIGSVNSGCGTDECPL